jgi:hypothetical protein
MATNRNIANENMQKAADSLFAELGFETPTILRLFIDAATKKNESPSETEDETPESQLEDEQD